MSEQKDNTISIKRLSEDNDFYTNVFKRTEKLVSVILYVLSHIDTKDNYQDYKNLIKDKSLKTHEVSLRTLMLYAYDAEEGIVHFQHTLLSLDSTLRIAEAAGVLPSDITLMLTEQIDSIFRYLNNHYLKNVGMNVYSSASLTGAPKQSAPKQRSAPTTKRSQKVTIPAGDISTDAYMVYSQLTDRADRIKTVLEAKPQASVKDIAEVITDVSEKTIQRELNSLIEKGQVLREGERRWSRYSVAK
jgi:DNA-binding transcriptional ArsR family regulator